MNLVRILGCAAIIIGCAVAGVAHGLSSRHVTRVNDVYKRYGALEGYLQLGNLGGRFGIESRELFLRLHQDELVSAGLFTPTGAELEGLEYALCSARWGQSFVPIRKLQSYSGPGYATERSCVERVDATDTKQAKGAISRCQLRRAYRLCPGWEVSYY